MGEYEVEAEVESMKHAGSVTGGHSQYKFNGDNMEEEKRFEGIKKRGKDLLPDLSDNISCDPPFSIKHLSGNFSQMALLIFPT